MKRLVLLAALVGAAGSGPDAHAGACARIGLDAQILAHPADAIPAGGGILVGYGPAQRDVNDRGSLDPSAQADWKLRLRKKKLRTTVTTIAPGLSVYRAKGKGKLTLVDGQGKKLGAYTFSGAKKPFEAGAPVLKALTVSTSQSMRGGSFTTATVTLDGATPDGAFALIVYDGTTALTWAEIDLAVEASPVVYQDPGRCGQLPPGMTAPSVGEKVDVAWVDRFGRISPHSAAVAVTDGDSVNPSGRTVRP